MPPRRAIKKSELVGFIAAECVMSFYGRYSGIMESPKVCHWCLQLLFEKCCSAPQAPSPWRSCLVAVGENNPSGYYIYVNFNGSNRSHSQNVNSLNGAAIGRSRLTIAVRGSLFITIQISCLILLSAYFKIKNSLSFAATFPFIYFFKVIQSWRINKKCLTIVCELYSW